MLSFFVIVVLVALGLQWLSLHRAADHRHIRYNCRPSVRACEPGEEFLVLSDVANHGRKPSPAIRIEEHFPRELDVREAERFNVKWLTKEHRVYYSTVLLRGHQQIKRSLRASIARRGEYGFSYADFFAGDVLGFREYAYRMENDSRIVIYPARLEKEALPETFSDALDDLARKKQLLEDPISVCGYRGYTGAEPMRQISWTQSAAHSELIVKQYDPVWQRAVLIALDTDIHGDFDAYLEQLELCYSLARTVCEQLEQRDIGYQLVTNAPLREELSGFSSSGGMGGSFRKILYALGSAKGGSIAPVEELIHAVGSGPRNCEMIVFLSTHCDRRVERALDQARELKGGRIVPLFVDRLRLNGTGPSKEEEVSA